MQYMAGIVTVVQEGRFRLSTDDGRSILFTLDGSAAIEPQDLPSLLARGRVGVDYSTPTGRKALVAHGICIEGGR